MSSHLMTTRHDGFHYHVYVEQKYPDILTLGELNIESTNANTSYTKEKTEK